MVTQIMWRTCERKQDFYEKEIKLATALDLNKCLKHIKFPISLHAFAPFSELPSNISFMLTTFIAFIA